MNSAFLGFVKEQRSLLRTWAAWSYIGFSAMDIRAKSPTTQAISCFLKEEKGKPCTTLHYFLCNSHHAGAPVVFSAGLLHSWSRSYRASGSPAADFVSR
jgi:hypothetical protein